MFTGYVYFISLIALNLLSILTLYHFSKYKGEPMVNMMMTMALSMVFGLAIGFFTGIAFHGDLLFSVLVSVMAAGTIGFMIGSRLHRLAGIEGFFSGMMAGMMGAMIVEMLTVWEGTSLLLVSVLLLISTTMFCMRHILQQTFRAFAQTYDYVLLVGTCLLLLAAFWTFPFADMQRHSPQHEENRLHSPSTH